MSCRHNYDDQGGCYICSFERERTAAIRERNERERSGLYEPSSRRHGRWGRGVWLCGCVGGECSDELDQCRRCQHRRPREAEVYAACVVIVRNKKFACIRARKDRLRVGLPGGKSLAGESARQTALRECREETGLLLHQMDHLYSARINGEMVATFRGFARGDLVSSEEGEAIWCSREQLLKEARFPQHTKDWLEIFGRNRENW